MTMAHSSRAASYSEVVWLPPRRAVKFNGAVYGFVKGRSAVDAAALHSILHDHRRIVEFDCRIDMKLLANHRCDALVHERTGGTFIVPQIDSASSPAVLRTQELFPD